MEKRLPIMSRLSILAFCLTLLLSVAVVHGQSLSDTLKAEDLIPLTFEELMNVKINTGTLTGIEPSKLPVSLTTISAEEIALTPYRNLLDLLEVYVPGATFTNQWLGPRIGLRGVMSDRNYSYLLLVDGENMNSQAENAPVFEFQNKDLLDIEKIEITRGPGSVTYGPGAIGGVISITTKNAKTADKAHVGIKHDFTYRYSTLNSSFSIKKKDFSAYLYGSVSRSEGISDPKFYYIDRAYGYGYGYMSEDFGNKGLGTPAPNFYADFEDKPEVKINFEMSFLNEFIFRVRYTNFSFIKQQQQTFASEGGAFPGLYGQQMTSSLTNKHEFSKKIELETSMSFQSQSHGTITLFQGASKPFDDVTQRQDSYAENKIKGRSVLSYTPNDKLKLAFGAEYNYWYYKPEWGKSKNSFVMDFPSPIKFAVLNESSGFYQQYNSLGIVTEIDEAITANQVSGFFEVNYEPLEKTTLLFSARVDKHNLADVAFSPRMAVIQQINKNNYLRLIVQQSVRLPGFRELYSINYASGAPSSPERLRGAEFIYTHIQSENFTMNASLFYQSIDQIGWVDDERTGLIGTFETAGTEAEVAYKLNDLKLGLSYSYIKQLGWSPENEMSAYLSRIGLDSADVPLANVGENRINNFPQHQLKLTASYAFTDALHVHFNGRFAGSYGQLDMLNSFKAVHDEYGLPHTKNEMTAIYDDLQDKGYGKPSFTSNMSVNYTIPINNVSLSVSAWAMNLIAINNIRYVHQFWEEGDSRQFPRQVGFVDEPVSLGMSLNANF